MTKDDIRHRLLSRRAFTGLLFCALFPFGWGYFYPQLDPQAYVALLASNPLAIQSSTPMGTLPVRSMGEGVSGFVVGNAEWREYQFTLDKGGVYTLLGAERRTLLPVMDLILNDRLVSAHAFYRGTDPDATALTPKRIATRVALNQGVNTVRLEGTDILGRDLALVFRPEKDLSAGRYALVFSIAVSALICILLAPLKNPASTGGRLLLTISTLALFVVGSVALVATLRGEDLVNLGILNRDLHEKLESFEAFLESPEHREGRTRPWNIAVLGDSTQFWQLDPSEQMRPVMQRSIPAQSERDVHLYGMALGGFSAFDYYFLLNRLISEEPDLVVMAVNQRWFSDARLYGPKFFDFYSLESYLRPSELPRLLPVEIGSRDFTLRNILYRRWSANATARRLEYFEQGTSFWSMRFRRYLDNHLHNALSLPGRPIPPELHAVAAPGFSDWNNEIASDHDMFDMYRLINALAEKHGIKVLYYPCNQNVEAQAELGVDLKLVENTAVIKRTITRNANIYFLDISPNNPREMFSDTHDHLTPDGIKTVAERLTRAAIAILDDAPIENVPELEQGPL